MTCFRTLKYLLLLAITWPKNRDSHFGCQAQPVDERCEAALPVVIDGDAILSSTVGQGIGSSLFFNRCGDGEVFDITTPGTWFRLTGTSATLRATTCSNETDDFQHRITVFAGNPGCDDRLCLQSGKAPSPDCPFSNTTYVEWDTIPGTEYFLYVHDRFTDVLSSGSFSLAVEDVTEPPENDSCEKAITLEEDVSTAGTTVGATKSTGLQCDRCIEGGPKYPGVWYSIPAVDFNSTITIKTCSNFIRLDVSVFAGTSCDDFDCLRPPASAVYNATCSVISLASEFEWTAEAGQEFLLYVHAFDDENELKIGSFQLLYSQQEIVTTDLGSSDALRIGTSSACVGIGLWLSGLIWLL